MADEATESETGKRPPPRVTAASRAVVARIGAVLLAERHRPIRPLPRLTATPAAASEAAAPALVATARQAPTIPSSEARMPVLTAATDATLETAATASLVAAQAEPQAGAKKQDVDEPG
ncbi:MAG: hypothetical protein ACK4MF_09220, partial [Hyphomicrobiaceae bacterium]